MSEQKMREALDYIAGLAAADDARDLPTIAATAQEALAQPADVGLTDEETLKALKLGKKWMQHWLEENLCDCEGEHYCGKTERQTELSFIEKAIQAHEAKKNGGGV